MTSVSASEMHSQKPSQSFTRLEKSGKPTLLRVISEFWEDLAVAYLVTENNIKGYGLSVVSFAVFSITSGSFTSGFAASWEQQLYGFMHTALYTWFILFYFDLGNQKDPESVEEDKINKPWRAIPSGRLSIEKAEQWYVRAILLLSLSSGLWLGGFPEAITFIIAARLHDAGGLADSWWGKNLCCSIFFMSGNFGGSRVAAQTIGLLLTRQAFEWSLLIGLTILTTIHIQDLRDQLGDSARGRRTVPLLFGDMVTRVMTAVLVLAWSIACPMYWKSSAAVFGLPLLSGCYIAARMVWCRSAKADRLTYHWYTMLWLPVLYSVPLLSRW